jgi:Tfp pilus assembly protein PilP
MRLLSAFAVALLGISAWAAADVPAHAAQIVKPPAATVQAASAAPPTASPATGPSAADPQPMPYTYSPEGRRDPFQSLTTSGADGKSAPKPTAAGIAGIRVDELSVRGIMQSRERLVAMVQGADNRTYLIHQGDKLADGVVKSITPQGLVLVQDVSDPHATDKTREVRKLLRTPEDDKE